MIEQYLKKLSGIYWKSNSDDHKLEHYVQMREHPGWQVHQEFLMHVFQEIGNELLSKKFTNRTAEEKDVLQRTYHNMAEVIKFLLDPAREGKKQLAILQHNRNITKETTERK